MKFFSNFLLLLLLLVSAEDLMAQQDVTRCYTVESDAKLRALHPELGTLDEFEEWLQPLVREYENSPQLRAVSTIPIIFHVIHDNEAVGTGDNISATYINAQLDQLNNDFRKILGTSGHNSHASGADTEVEFCLAVVDENGNTLAEPGINRINRTSQGWTAPPYGTCVGANQNLDNTYIQNTIKPQSQWDPDKYLNVWLMDVNCNVLGYAQFPSSSGLSGLNSSGGASNTDGVVFRPSTIGSTTTPNPNGGQYNQGRTATHEIGHFFGLRHIWGDGPCGTDDFCGDTPESDNPNFGCPTGHVSCGSTDMIENYMDYTDDSCMNIFTGNQKSRIQTVLANSPRRGVLANSTVCSGGGSSCSTTISSFPYAESFESGFGAWTQASGDDFDWSRTSGTTPSSNTGPSSASAGTYYIYTETSNPNNPNKNTILNGPCFDLSGESTATFTFEYHMYGASSMGDLKLEARTTGGSWATVWSKVGNQGNNWLSASINLSAYLGATMELRFNGTSGSTWQGDMAVDDISLSTGGGGNSCSTTISSFPYTEGFESGFGAWTQASGDDFDWTRKSGTTPSSNTGPSSASAGTFYVYTETSNPNNPNKNTILNGPCFDLSGESAATFDFKYHMYGASSMGDLKLEARTTGGTWASVWSKVGNQGNSWLSASVNLNAYTGGTMELRFNGTSGSTWQGDMAVDDMSLSTGPTCTDVTITITFDDYPEETSWVINNAGGTTVASGGTYGSQADRSTLSINACLSGGCYDFVISDVYGDGICCSYGNGSYTVTGGGSTLASGATFGSSETTNFCVSGNFQSGPSSVKTTAPRKHLTCYPNPVRDILSIDYESKTTGEVQVKVVNLLGATIHSTNWRVVKGHNVQQLNLNDLTNGTYLIVIENEESRVSQRFIVIE